MLGCVSPTATSTKTQPKDATEATTVLAPLWNVILLDDDDHSYEYVIEMLGAVFGHPPEKSFGMAVEVDATGRAIVFTSHRELAELKQEQIHAYGKDWRIDRCAGSMSAVIEPTA